MNNTMPTLSVRVDSDYTKQSINDLLDDIQRDGKATNKGEALQYIIRQFQELKLEGKKLGADFVPPNVQDILNSIACEYLKFLEVDFYCFEQAAKKKKPVLLNGTPEEVNLICKSCNRWKTEKKINELEVFQRRQYVKRFNTFAKNLMRIGERGIIADVWFCIHDRLDGELIFSRDGATLRCPLEKDDIVFIEETCKTLLDPDTGEPPCQYLTKTDRVIHIDKEVFEKEGLEIPVLEDIGIEHLDKQPRQVEAEFEEVNDEETGVNK